LILNNITSDFYIGSALSKNEHSNRIYIRYRNHFFSNAKVPNVFLRNSLKKYGKKNFSFHILSYEDNDSVREAEKTFIKNLEPKYNFSAYGSSSYKHSSATKLKTKKNSGRKGELMTDHTELLLSTAASKRRQTSKKCQEDLSSSFVPPCCRPASVYCARTQTKVVGFDSAKEL
jgi:group I intron endonuclease